MIALFGLNLLTLAALGAPPLPQAPVATSGAVPPTSLRQAISLIEKLDLQDISPPLPKSDPLACVNGQTHAPWLNPFSGLDKPLAKRHVRLTLSPGPAQVEFRDALLVEAPRRLAWQVTPLEQPRLELAYRVFTCGGSKARLDLIVRTIDATGTWETRVPLSRDKKKSTTAFHEVSVDLPLAAAQAARLEVEFVVRDEPGRGRARDQGRSGAEGRRAREERRKESGLIVALAEPVLTGLDPTPSLADTNVLWIVIDAVRGDAMGPGRQFEPSASPEIDRRIFARGTGFRQAYTMGNQTRTSTVAMLASVPPSIGGFHSHSWAFTSGRRETFYAKDPPLVPLVLAEHGFRTAHFGHNHFLWSSEIIGLDHGFDRAVDFRSIPSDAVDASAAAVTFFERNRDQRWMLMLNYTAPHTPYKPPDELLEKARNLQGVESDDKIGFLPRTYLGEILWVDQNLQSVFAALEAQGLLDRTLVIVTADHGEVMNPAHDCASALLEQPCAYNHSLTVYDDELLVPLGLSLPGRILENRTIDTPISQADLGPTILDVLGLPPAPGQVGRSLRPALEGGNLSSTAIYADGRLAAALRLGRWKLIVHAPQDDTRPRTRLVNGDYPKYELFDLDRDPLELDNLSVAHPELTAAMASELRVVRQDLAARFERQTPTYVADQLPGHEADSPEVGASDHNHFLLQADGAPRRLTGSITSPSNLTCLVPAPTCTQHDPRTLLVDLQAAANTQAQLAFEAIPSGAPLDLTLALDARPIAADRLRLGPWGLALLAPGETLSGAQNLALATSPSAPVPQPREAAVYFWRRPVGAAHPLRHTPNPAGHVTDPTSPEDGGFDPEADEQLGGEVKKILKDLGYTH